MFQLPNFVLKNGPKFGNFWGIFNFYLGDISIFGVVLGDISIFGVVLGDISIFGVGHPRDPVLYNVQYNVQYNVHADLH